MNLQEAWAWSDNENKCSKNKLCSFDVVLSNEEIQVERCAFCHKRIMFNVVGGRVDNKRYLRAHVRDTLQPHGRTGNLFREIYGLSPLKEMDKMQKLKKPKKSEDEWRAEAQDTFKTVKGLLNSGYKVEEI